MRKAYITGTSSGIGKALAERFLENGDAVVGIARRESISHENYMHIKLDLSDLDAVERFSFSFDGDFSEVILINNAGWLGEVKPVGALENKSIARLNAINVSAPCMLMNSFIKHGESYKGLKTIVNISSGAAQYPIESWAGYCASKAALDMFSRVIKEEHPDISVMSIAPGVVDTEMQQAIRAVPENDFKDSARFHEMHKKGELNSSENVAKQIVSLIDHKENAPNTVFSLREL